MSKVNICNSKNISLFLESLEQIETNLNSCINIEKDFPKVVNSSKNKRNTCIEIVKQSNDRNDCCSIKNT